MKENVIIGKLIPAGTGMKRYRDIQTNTEIPENPDIQTIEEMTVESE